MLIWNKIFTSYFQFITLVHILKQEQEAMSLMQKDKSFCFLMKRFLVLSLINLQGNDRSDLYLNNLYTFSNNWEVLDYLLKKGKNSFSLTVK